MDRLVQSIWVGRVFYRLICNQGVCGCYEWVEIHGSVCDFVSRLFV